MSVQDKTDFTQGSIIRKMLPFMGPILGALILQAAYGAVDLLAVVMVTFARPLSVLMQAPAEAVTLTSSYVRICGGGIFFIMAYNVLTAIFRGFGDSKSPLIFVFVACIVNVIGDLILVVGCHLDAAGAAIMRSRCGS